MNSSFRTHRPSSRLAALALSALAVAAPASADEIENGLYLPFDQLQIAGSAVTLNGNAVIALPDIDFTLDVDRLITEVTIQGADGTVTTLRLSDIEAGVELPPDTFEPAWGPDVEVVDLGSEPPGGGAP